MISGAGLCWQHVGGVGSTTTTTTFTVFGMFIVSLNFNVLQSTSDSTYYSRCIIYSEYIISA